MSPFLPAARAHQAERHLALDVRIRRNPLYIDPSPGARSNLGSVRRWDRDEYYEEEPGTDSPVVTADVLSSSTQGPTTTTAVQVSTILGIPTISLTSSLVPPSNFPEVTSPSDTSSSSLPPATNTTPGTATPQHTGRSSQSPHLKTTTSQAATTPAAESNPLRDGSTGGVSKGTGLSGGAIAAVVIVILLAMGALAFLFLRGRRIRRRTARRVTWTTNAWQRPTTDASLEKGTTAMSPIPLPDIGGAIGSSSTRGNEGGTARSAAVPIILRKSPPPYIPATQPRSHDSPIDSSFPGSQPSAVRMVASESTQDPMALVRVTFVPQLPDELAITPGETLYIRTEFDDGWALCANTRGEQGMVPLECLESGGGQFAELPPPSVDWHSRDVRRVSSLRSTVA